MKKMTLKQLVIPLSTLAIIIFMWFGPIHRMVFENVIISLLIFLANFIEYRGKLFSALGFHRKKFTFKNIFLWAPLAALGLFAFYVFVLLPLITQLTGVPIDLSNLKQLEGNPEATLIWLVIAWVTGGFCEEIIFRGYFMRQFVKFFGESKISITINILLFSSFFGFMHMQQGITGQLVAGTTGALLAIIFYIRKYDLWFNIAVHGFFNTLGILSFYFGLT